MDAKRIHEDITHLLYKVEEQYGRIIHSKDSIPLIEVDLALKDVRDLYESFLDLRTAAELKRRKSASELVTSRVEEPVAEKIEKPSFVETKVQEIEVESPKEEVIAEVTSEKEGAAIELKLDGFFMSSFKNAFDSVQTNRSVKPSDMWKYQVGRDPGAESKAQLRHYIAILDRNTIKYEDTIRNWIATHKK